jgi:hypothetical protein
MMTVHCPNKIRRWWSLWFKVRCATPMVDSADPCAFGVLLFCPCCGHYTVKPEALRKVVSR